MSERGKKKDKVSLILQHHSLYPPGTNPRSKPYADCCTTAVVTVICLFSLQKSTKQGAENQKQRLISITKAYTQVGEEWGDGDGREQ